MEDRKLAVAFESEKLTYSSETVDLYNTGITQILSVAAARGHELFHFSMPDLYRHENEPYARASVLELPAGWEGDPITSYKSLTKVADRPLKLSDLDICFARGDDIRNVHTENLDVLKPMDDRGALFESIKATLATTDKFELVKRVPDVPQPQTYAASSVSEARRAVEKLPKEAKYFIIKDRFGFGCGLQVHRVAFSDPEIDKIVEMYLSKYTHILIQEFCPEVRNGDLVVTFFDGNLIAPMLREPAFGEWKTNLTFGSNQIVHVLTNEQERIARAVIAAFPEIRYASVDMLDTGKILEINAFPGGKGLYEIYGVSVGAIIMDKIESEILKVPSPPSDVSISLVEQPITPWSSVHALYRDFEPEISVLDVFCEESYALPIQDLIDFTPRSNDYILSVPHSGILVPEEFTGKFDLDPACFKEVDMLSDILYEGLNGLQLVSRLAPFFVDMNRTRDGIEDNDLPAHLKNSAVEYYTIDNKLFLKEAYTAWEREKVMRYYELYHNILTYLTRNMVKERGYALIIDGHSMSSVGWGRVKDKGRQRSNFVVGTLDERSADSQIIYAFCDALQNAAMKHNLGLSIARDKPYSGGFITRHHNDPDNHVHVIQLEVTMDTYMHEAVEKDKIKRYALKQPRIKIVQDIISHAIEAASRAAKHLQA